MAREEEVVLGRDGERVPHERGRVDAQRAGHLARDSARVSFLLFQSFFIWSPRVERGREKRERQLVQRTGRDSFACPALRRRECQSLTRDPRSLCIFVSCQLCSRVKLRLRGSDVRGDKGFEIALLLFSFWGGRKPPPGGSRKLEDLHYARFVDSRIGFVHCSTGTYVREAKGGVVQGNNVRVEQT